MTLFEDTLSELGVDSAPPQRREPHLVVVLECDKPDAGSSRHALARVDEVVIGRGAEHFATREVVDGAVRLTLRVPDRWMSADHARLVRSGGRFVVEDGGSRNGSAINGAPVRRAPVRAGDVLELGHTLFEVAYEVVTPEGTPLDVRGSGDAAAMGRGTVTLHPELEHLFAAVGRVAASAIPVVIQGESGSGKELLARTIHERSGRRGPFVAINCGALPQTLVESQLFGFVKGAFSGANRDEPGLVRTASGGTLFLDEIGDLPPSAQAALLRVLQEGEVLAVGATRPVSVDLRVVSATHRSLDALVAKGDFRGDLRARLTGYTVTLPPVRERRIDLGVMIASVLCNLRGEGPVPPLRVAAGRALLRYDWPSNARELRQCLALAVTLAAGGPVEPKHLAEAVAKHAAPVATEEPAAPAPLDEADAKLRAELVARLEQHRGNVSEVARSFGRARMQIHRWMARFGLEAGAFRTGE
jgi:DNA-binding NtrC family response regulator